MAVKILLLLVGLAMVTASHHELKLNDDKTSLSTSGEHSLGLFGYNQFFGYANIFDLGWELAVIPDVNFDLGIGYNIYINKYNQWLVFNPTAYFIVGGPIGLQISLGIVKVKMWMEFDWLKFNFADYQLAYNAEEGSEFCQGVSWFMDIIKQSIWFQWDFYECEFGLVGLIMLLVDSIYGTTYADVSDCSWNTYKVDYRLWEFEILEWLNVYDDIPELDDMRFGEWLKYKCYEIGESDTQ